MQICGEHGDEIVYMGRDCPACGQIDDIELEYKTEIDNLEDEHKMAIEELETEIETLEEEAEALNEELEGYKE